MNTRKIANTSLFAVLRGEHKTKEEVKEGEEEGREV